MKNIFLILLVLVSFGMGERPRYMIGETCTDTTTGKTVELKKCKGNQTRYVYEKFCRDTKTGEKVDMSYCGVTE